MVILNCENQKDLSLPSCESGTNIVYMKSTCFWLKSDILEKTDNKKLRI